jgi:squalene-associated FAD-dependent desaturase
MGFTNNQPQPEPKHSNEWDTIVIGAGCAGMASATALTERGKKVLVLEKRNILGGRACSYPDPQTNETVDNGQHLLLGCYTETIKLLSRIGNEDKLKFNSGFQTPMVGPDRSVAYLKTFCLPAPLHILLGFLNYKALSFKDRLGIIRVARALKKQDANLKNISCTTWLDSLGQSENSRKKFWDLVILATLNISPDKAPANLLAVVLKQGFLSSKKASRVGLASVGLSELYADPSRNFIEKYGGEVQINKTVEEIRFENDGVQVKLSSGETFASQNIICTVPPSALAKIKIVDSKLEGFLKTSLTLLPSPILSFHFWGDMPKFADTYVGFWGTNFHWAFQKSHVYGDNKTKHWTLVASSADDMIEKSKEELTRLAESELLLIPGFGHIKISRAKIVHEREATWVPPLGDTSGRLPTITPNSRFFLAGDWTDTGLPCTIESAVLSGHKAAEMIQ